MQLRLRFPPLARLVDDYFLMTKCPGAFDYQSKPRYWKNAMAICAKEHELINVQLQRQQVELLVKVAHGLGVR